MTPTQLVYVFGGFTFVNAPCPLCVFNNDEILPSIDILPDFVWGDDVVPCVDSDRKLYSLLTDP